MFFRTLEPMPALIGCSPAKVTKITTTEDQLRLMSAQIQALHGELPISPHLPVDPNWKPPYIVFD